MILMFVEYIAYYKLEWKLTSVGLPYFLGLTPKIIDDLLSHFYNELFWHQLTICSWTKHQCCLGHLGHGIHALRTYSRKDCWGINDVCAKLYRILPEVLWLLNKRDGPDPTKLSQTYKLYSSRIIKCCCCGCFCLFIGGFFGNEALNHVFLSRCYMFDTRSPIMKQVYFFGTNLKGNIFRSRLLQSRA